MKLAKRMGWLGMCFTVLLASLAVQVAASLLTMLPVTVLVGIKAGLQGITDGDTLARLSNEAVNGLMPVTLVITHLMLLLCFGLWYRFGCGVYRPQKAALKGIFTCKNVGSIVLIAGGMCFFTNFFMNLLYPVIPAGIMENYEILMESAGFGESLLPTVAAVFIAPFGEEFIFRGVLFYYAKYAVSDCRNKRIAFWIANTIQALCFGIFHFNLIQGTYAFFIGLALGYLADRFKSVLPAMLGHMIINAVSSFVWTPTVNLLPETGFTLAAGTLLSLAVVLLGFYLGRETKKKCGNF